MDSVDTLNGGDNDSAPDGGLVFTSLRAHFTFLE
jgi:hypothetical protein